jgi:hypothetical protein
MAQPVRERAPLPEADIRRFDVFAEYNRIKAEQSGMAPDQAKGYALWLAKVIAARKFTRKPEQRAEMTELLGEGRDRLREGARYLELGGQLQTPELFDREIVRRMGEHFYRSVFSPAIAEAIAQHRSYEKIRDAIRIPWNLARAGLSARNA